MKSWEKILALVVACAPLAANAAWSTNYDAALARARAERRLILVDLRPGADPIQDRFIALSERPFRVRINLGSTPRLHSLEAVGFDDKGNPATVRIINGYYAR